MSANTIACICIADAGFLMIIISLFFFNYDTKRKKRCAAQVEGIVTDYRIKYRSNNVAPYITPIVEFSANGKNYRACRKYKSICAIKITSSLSDNSGNDNDRIYVTDKDVLHLYLKGRQHNYRELAQNLWPLGSTLKVVYNPDNPKQAYAEKVVTCANLAGTVLLCCGAGFILLAILAFIIFQ